MRYLTLIAAFFLALSTHAQGLGGKAGVGGKAGIGGGVASGGSITVVQQTGTSAAQISSCTTCQVELPSAAGSGHLIVVSIASVSGTNATVSSVCDSSSSGTCSSSESTYSIINPVQVSAVNIIQSVYTCSSASGVQYINLTMTAAVSDVGIMGVEVSNVPSCGLDATACPSSTCPSFTGTASSSPVTTGTFSTASSIEIAIGFANDENNCQTFSASSGNTLLTTPTCTQTGMGGIYQIYSSTQSTVTQSIGISVTGDPTVFSVAVFK